MLKAQLKAEPEKSDRQHAQDLGVSPTTVGKVRKDLEDKNQLSKMDTSEGSDGKKYSRKKKHKKQRVSVFNPTKREERAMKNPAVVEQGTNCPCRQPVSLYLQREKFSRKSFTRSQNAHPSFFFLEFSPKTRKPSASNVNT